MATSNNRFLLQEIMVEVLSKLPVKSLLRFRCVCKSWHALFRNTKFISKHLNNEDNYRLFVSFMVEDKDDPFAYPTDRLCLFPDETLTTLSMQDLDLYQSFREFLGGPFDGIFCINGSNSNRLILWNLATKETRLLPKLKVFFPRYTKILSTNIGFGLDTINNDYKLVMIFGLWNVKTKLGYEFSHVAVYTLHNNSWRVFEYFKVDHYCMHGSSDSIHLDGICYWLSSFLSDSQKVMLSFHMGTEMFQEIHIPDNISELEHVTLGLYDYSIALLCLDEVDNLFDIWIMKERHWTKILTVGPLIGVGKPIGLWKKNTFFLHSNNEHLLLYEPSNEETRDLGFLGLFISVNIYKESLIPIKGGDNWFEFFDIPWHILNVSLTD